MNSLRSSRIQWCLGLAIGNRSTGAGFLGLLLVALTITWSGPAAAEVLFQNTGNTRGWGRVFTQKAGTITEVASPVYKGSTSVKTTQTYQTSDSRNYHSEIIKEKAHLAGQDLYYGHAVYLPPDWVFHNQNVTFQQWAPEQPEAPWILMYLQGEKIRLGGRGANGDKDAGSVAGLRGTWIRFVTRIHMATNGAFEVWINGNKTFSQNGNFRAHGPSMRWSNGIYCTRWDTETPTGPRELTFWHDNMRIATTYAEADPATWDDDDAGPTGAGPGDGGAEVGGPADGGAGRDAVSVDAAGGGGGGGASTGGATGGGGTGGTGGSMGGNTGGATAGSGGLTGGRGGSAGGRGGGVGSGGSVRTTAPASGGGDDGGGCVFAPGSGGGAPAAAVILLGLAVAGWARRCRRRGR